MFPWKSNLWIVQSRDVVVLRVRRTMYPDNHYLKFSSPGWYPRSVFISVNWTLLYEWVCSDSEFGPSPHYGVCKINFTPASHTLRKSIIFRNFGKKRFIICNIFWTFSNEISRIFRAAWSEDARHDLPLIACITYGKNGFLETLGFFFRIFKKLNEKLKIIMEKLKKS